VTGSRDIQNGWILSGQPSYNRPHSPADAHHTITNCTQALKTPEFSTPERHCHKISKRSTGTNIYLRSTVGYAIANDATTNECYNEQFLSIKSGCYNERGGILSADVARAWVCRVWPSRFD